MNSMTGYGKGVADGERKITVEMKSVNHRFLDILFKLPKGMQFTEDVIRKAISDEFSRGHIEVFLNYEDNRKDKNDVVLDKNLAMRYLAAAKELQEMGFTQNYGVAEALRTPDIVKTVESDDDENIIKELAAAAAKECVKNLAAMRACEGEKLIADIQCKIAELKALLDKVAERAPAVAEDYRNKLTARLKDALQNVVMDEGKIAAEAAVFIDRSNVDEEITRLKGHLAHYAEIFENGGAVGKKLDFLTQEANREVNTIGSKSNDLELTKLVLAMKNQVEMIREQVQNLE